MRWLKGGAFVLPLFIFCAELEMDKKSEPFFMPLLPQERGKPTTKIVGQGSIKVEDYDAFVRAVSKEKIRTRDYLRLEWDSEIHRD